MAVSEFYGMPIIHLSKTKTVYLGTSSSEISFSYTLPSNYTLVSAAITYNYVYEVVGGVEQTSATKTSGYYRITTSAKNILFGFKGLAVPNEMLRIVNVT